MTAVLATAVSDLLLRDLFIFFSLSPVACATRSYRRLGTRLETPPSLLSTIHYFYRICSLLNNTPMPTRKRVAGLPSGGGGADKGRPPTRIAKSHHHLHPIHRPPTRIAKRYHHLHPISKYLGQVAHALSLARTAVEMAQALHAQREAQRAMTGAMSSPAVTLDQEKVDE